MTMKSTGLACGTCIGYEVDEAERIRACEVARVA